MSLWQHCERHARDSVGDRPECVLEEDGGVGVMEMHTHQVDGETFVKLTDVIRFFQGGVDGFDPDARVNLGPFCEVIAAHLSELLDG